ncbi:MAG: ATP-binding protein, partial [Thermoanaerobaculia bacterium]|nr:ATP-binding protein [Thermoanaerobaculia bacterium]
GAVRLVQEIDEDVQAGFLIYLPLYRGDEIPEELIARRESLTGFVYAPFRADDLLENIFGTARPGVAFRIYDGTDPGEEDLLHTSARWGEAIEQSGLTYRVRTRMRVAGRLWTLDLISLPGLGAATARASAATLAAVGVLISLMLFVLTRSQTKARVAAETAASELRSSRRSLRQTEMRVRRLVESNIIGIMLGGEGGTVSEANDAFLTMIGHSRGELGERSLKLEDLSADSSRGVIGYALKELERKGRFGPWEHTFVAGDGREVPALVGMALVEAPRTEWVAFVLDQSERKHLETRLVEQKETLETLSRVQRVLSAELEVESVLAVVSEAAVALSGASEAAFFRQESLAEADFSFVDPRKSDDDQGELRRDHPAVERALTEVGPERTEEPEFKKEGVFAVPVVSRFGSVVGALAVRDPERDELPRRDREVLSTLSTQAAIAIDNATLYEQARRDRNRAEKANRAKDQFLANLSHELRTPVTAIIGWARMLEFESLEGEEYEEAVTAISRSARAQARLIEDILDVSRITTGKMKIEQRPTDLLQVIDSAVDSIWPSVEEKSLHLETTGPDEPLMVEGDPHRLQQVIWNLLANAVKFNEEGGRIKVVATRTETDAIIEISDTGLGIDPSELPDLFERFRQVDGTTTRRFGGLGLGLSLVDYIVRAHGGLATVESEGVGKGATFRIELPLAEIPEIVESTAEKPSEQIRSLHGTSVLLVEQDREIREMVHVLLRRAGAKVRSVTGISQARDHVVNEDFDVLISDVSMNLKESSTLLRDIRRLTSEDRTLPAVAVTSWGGEEEESAILSAGYDLLLVKPLAPLDLVRAVEELVTARESARGT